MTMQDFWEVVRQVIGESDIVVEVIEARMPEETRNRKAESMVRIARKPLIFAVNKSDLITMKEVKKHRRQLEAIAPCVFVSTKNRRGITFLKKKIFEIGKKRSRRSFLKVGIIGYPNTGKSSLINALAGKKKTLVARKPGVTRGMQWIAGGPGIGFIDTPGVIPFSDKNEMRQMMIGVIDPSKIKDHEEAAAEVIRMVLSGNKSVLERAYGIQITSNRVDRIIQAIGKAKNMIAKGGVVDERRVCIALVNDWQKGKLRVKAPVDKA